jgi:hypothetical protein
VRKVNKRFLRLLSLLMAAGLSALGAGNIPINGINALDSFLFGASMILLFVAIILFTIYALKGELPDTDFDATIQSAVQQIQTNEDKKAGK